MNSCALGMGLGGFGLLATIAALIALAVGGGVWLAHRLRADNATPALSGDDDDHARDVLRRRYAAGEIDEEEFERRLAALTWR